jgi:hypothetical protein
MANKLLVVSEIKQHSDRPLNNFWSTAPKFWHQLPANKTQTDQLIRSAWYNIDLESWDPQLINETPDISHIISLSTFQIEFKIPSPRPIVMFSYDHPEYLKRLEYCRDNNITITIEEVAVDGQWNRVITK